ncbi:MAG TPA: aldo/keto reductase [Stellaceae bacterium]|nr:aldo/keto reductase [Stellaceae bacterium]
METMQIAETGIFAPRIALGTWAIGGSMWGGTDERQAIATVQSAVERGVTMIDTAPVYGFGRSEEVIGKALAQSSLRDKVLVATKLGLEWRGGKIWRNASPTRIRQEVEDSLRRLKTDRIDLYQVHWPDEAIAIEETAGALVDLLAAGKIRMIGVSNFTVPEMQRFQAVAPLHTVQPPFNLFERGIEKDVLPYAKAKGLAVLAYGPLCRGLLSGRMSADTTFDGDDLRNSDPKFQMPRRNQYLEAVAQLAAFARERHDRSVLALAVRWVLDRGRTVALWGARRPEQLDAIDEARGWVLSAEDMATIDSILARTIKDPVGPEFMAPPRGKAA